jgi:hypothetical protein
MRTMLSALLELLAIPYLDFVLEGDRCLFNERKLIIDWREIRPISRSV